MVAGSWVLQCVIWPEISRKVLHLDRASLFRGVGH
jgi:hypothetical protein